MNTLIIEFFLKTKRNLSRTDLYIKSPDNTYLKASKYTFPFLHVVCDDFFNESDYNFLSNSPQKLNVKPLEYFLSEDLFLTIKQITKIFDLSSDIATTTNGDFQEFSYDDIRNGYNDGLFYENSKNKLNTKEEKFLKNNFIKEHEKNNVLEKSNYTRKKRMVSVYYFNNEKNRQTDHLYFYKKNIINNKFYNVCSIKNKNNRIIFFEINKKTFHKYKEHKENKGVQFVINWFYR